MHRFIRRILRFIIHHKRINRTFSKWKWFRRLFYKEARAVSFMDELSIPWNVLIHPDMDAIKRRDEALLKAPDYIQNQDGSVTAEMKIDLRESH